MHQFNAEFFEEISSIIKENEAITEYEADSKAFKMLIDDDYCPREILEYITKKYSGGMDTKSWHDDCYAKLHR